MVGYGKLGGKELGYASDLDLIFLYDDDHPDAADNYARLSQRINTWLTSFTRAGVLYETDLRLRPDGASGLLVSRVDAFAEYQRSKAWVWEHQALTRARFVAGDQAIGAAFERLRVEILRLPRELAELRSEVQAMRSRMLAGHPNKSGLFDIKHDRGGIVDVEFIVQYLVLGFAHRHRGADRQHRQSRPAQAGGRAGADPRPARRAPCTRATGSSGACSTRCGCRASSMRGCRRNG